MNEIDRRKLRERCEVALDGGFVGSTWRSQQSELIATIPVLLDSIESLEAMPTNGSPTMTTKQLNVRLPHSSHDLLTELMQQLGMTQVQVVIVALEHLAMVKNVTPPPQK